ncbi:TusE/DsrC/DsvC family sulfur relay protein [Parasulfuritortus cantonensis]|uniref:TusE/DsrC/DsvC family sulfur relay protein n=2 Tax=Parasulfuritortus cantonensis TaxID=2528202 RepID=A0A4R1B896_9PROT|nr:TusE/DsrC/DsvC family sulfur relay protein [Parasulfuritortus cantonensis]
MLTLAAERDGEGYLIDPEAWDRDLARGLAAEEGLVLDALAWSIVDFMRAYWQEHRVAPDVRHVLEHLAQAHGLGRQAAKDSLFRVFPYGYVKQACKIAGMMRPRAWSTG